ncbi:MAG: restriction endonuclease [Undibacterium umbellatum]|uniref:restriction endonuclease n=1 Tax=Undibacterium umbellatum TaxID=2762300 RepID=UPI003BB5EDF2
MIDSSDRSPYFENRNLPFDALSPDEFEKFVAACLVCIGEALGIQITGMPRGSGDDGFDIEGVVIGSGRFVCVQCKRQKKTLGLDQVAHELAKVAATSKLANSDVGQHRFICTGGLSQALVRTLRETSRAELIKNAGERLATALTGELFTLKQKLENIGAEPRQVAETYVKGLDVLIAWDQDGLDTALTARWSSVLEIVERHFRVAHVVHEHPRPIFDRAKYIEEYIDLQLISEPRFIKAGLPKGIDVDSKYSKIAESTIAEREIKDVHGLLELNPGTLTMLLGDGGIGKTTTLAYMRAEVLRASSDTTIAVLISLTNYVPGALDRLIENELGITYGNWRMLPDRIFLLCDGLNECASEYVAIFFEELKLILKRKLVVCVISTRGSTRHRSVTLPQQPTACIEIEHLTPLAMRRIAESRLQKDVAAVFLTEYLAIANRAYSPQLWTPFALDVAIKQWTLNEILPASLGEMVEAVLYSRCTHDAQSASQQVGPKVVLQLARALAFQCLIVNRRIECPESEAGKWIRDAKIHCIDALGVEDMSQVSIVALLTRHELLRLSTVNHFDFGHQILIGALAAPILAENWQSYLHCTTDPIADDAWIFAARLVPQSDQYNFVKSMLDVDLILGARTARELPIERQEYAEKLLMQSVSETSPESVRVRGIFALSKLGTPGAVAKLRELIKGNRSEIQFQAGKGLAATGDVEYLRRVLNKVEERRSLPFSNVSGGDITIWETAPFSTRLDLARERLAICLPGTPVIESLALIAYERDIEDAKNVERQFHNGMDIRPWGAILHALHNTSPSRAQVILDDELANAQSLIDRSKIIQIAESIGIKFDIRVAFECVMAFQSADEPDTRLEFEIEELIKNVIAKYSLPPELIMVVESELASCLVNKCGAIWSMAKFSESAIIAAIAETTISTWRGNVGHACNYFLGQIQLARSRKNELLKLCEVGLENERTWHDWHSWRVLELVGLLGFTAKSAACLESMIRQLTRIRIAIESNQITLLSTKDKEFFDSMDVEFAEDQVGQFAAQLIRPAATARNLITSDVRLLFLHFDTSAYNVLDSLHELLRDLDSEAVDVELRKVTRQRTRFSALMAACTCGYSDVRLELLRIELEQHFTIPSYLLKLEHAINACWSKSIFDMVINTVANIPNWPDERTHFFWDFADMVLNHIKPDDQFKLESALASAHTPFAKRVLELWLIQAQGTRIGMRRLNGGANSH